MSAFSQLGTFLSRYLNETSPEFIGLPGDIRITGFDKSIRAASQANPWFTLQNIRFTIQYWANLLTESNLRKWTNEYESRLHRKHAARVAVIMAGNIPLVGMHDFLCTLIAGKSFLGKLSSDDDRLLPAIVSVLTDIEPAFREYIDFTGDKKIKGYDAVIATGSNNSARYFEYYFSHVPNIIRRNRNGVAVLSGNESVAEMTGLGEDICLYFGLGCRSVSKVYLPSGFDPHMLLKACEPFQERLFLHHKYMNNYTYQKTIMQMNRIGYFDNGVLLLTENSGYSSPIGVVHIEVYQDAELLPEKLSSERELIQCIVSGMNIPGCVMPGNAQLPELWDFADGINTLEFLSDL